MNGYVLGAHQYSTVLKWVHRFLEKTPALTRYHAAQDLIFIVLILFFSCIFSIWDKKPQLFHNFPYSIIHQHFHEVKCSAKTFIAEREILCYNESEQKNRRSL